MNRKINVRSGAVAVAVMAMAILTALVTQAAASNLAAMGSDPSPQSYLAGYPAQQSAPPAIEIAQASQLQNDVQPRYVPPPSTQGAPRQTLTLPQVAPQPSSGPAVELPAARGQERAVQVPQAPIERQPQTAVGRIPVTVTDNGRWVQDLRKQDLTLYEDGTQRPILGVQRDIDTPISIGIVVDTSGSMTWKLAAAEAALQHFVRTLNPRDQFFLIAFSSRSFLLEGIQTAGPIRLKV